MTNLSSDKGMVRNILLLNNKLYKYSLRYACPLSNFVHMFHNGQQTLHHYHIFNVFHHIYYNFLFLNLWKKFQTRNNNKNSLVINIKVFKFPRRCLNW
jgi:hypothetical protein